MHNAYNYMHNAYTVKWGIKNGAIIEGCNMEKSLQVLWLYTLNRVVY